MGYTKSPDRPDPKGRHTTKVTGGLDLLEQEVEKARHEEQVALALAEVGDLIRSLELRAVREEVEASEDELTLARARLRSMRDGVVLSGGFLERFHPEIRAEVARAEQIMADRREGDTNLFACRRIEAALSDVRGRIRAAKPASYEKEELQNHLEALESDYQLLVGPDPDAGDRERLLARIERDNAVDEGWLTEQKLKLDEFDTRSRDRRPSPPQQQVVRVQRAVAIG